MMRAMRFHSFGGPKVLHIDQLPDLVPGPDEVVVSVRACALNHVDLDIRNGVSRLPVTLPHTLGLEFAGEVVAVGQDVRKIQAGQRVTALHQVPCATCRWCVTGEEQNCEAPRLFGVHLAGGYASHVVVPAAAALQLPDKLGFVEAAACQTTFSTAWHALRRAGLKPGETLLVNAVGSGVGAAGVQVGRLLGATVIASAGTDEKLALAAAAGAVAGINYQEEALAARVRELTGGTGVDVVLECVGGNVLAESIEALAQNGRVVTVGAHADEVVPVDVIALFRRQASLIGSVRATTAEIAHVLNLVAEQVLRPVVHRTYPLEEAAQAQIDLAARRHYGKLVLIPALPA